jgi:hypothetical protein
MGVGNDQQSLNTSSISFMSTEEAKHRYQSAVGAIIYAMSGIRPDSSHSPTQQTVATSSTQPEYMAATEATKEAMWWRMFFKAIKKHNEGPTVICSDNQGSIALSKNPEHHRRTKHIDVQYHFVREQVAGKTVVFKFVPSIEMAADVLTKALPNPRHRLVIKVLGVDTLQSSLSGSVDVDRQPRLQ